MATYAAGTEVSSDRTRAEIERTLNRYGARQFLYGYDETRAVVGFTIHGRQVRFFVPLPDRDDYRRTPTGKQRTATATTEQWSQACRQRWRATLLILKAKLEAVESGIVTFDMEFLPHLVLPNNRTVADEVVPLIRRAYETNEMPALLPEYNTLAIEG
jgi:hypothetical protein